MRSGHGIVRPGVVKIPSSKSFVEGAMIEPVNTVLKAVKRLALLKGDCVLVAGQGPIGLLFTQLLTAMRMKVIAIDLLDHRLKRARDFGQEARTRRSNCYRALRCSRPTGIGIGAVRRRSPDFRPYSPRQ